MPEINYYSDVLSREMREVWPVVTQATANLKRSLIGGTALAMHLRHRQSFDLDILCTKGFSGEHLQRKLRKLCQASGFAFDEQDTGDGLLIATINGVAVDVVAHPQSTKPVNFKRLAAPFVVDRMPVASLPDLLAMKLDVIMFRPKLRDYIDIAAIDKAGIYTIEDGIRLHQERYGVPNTSKIPARILSLLQSPGVLSTDRAFAELQDETLDYLKERVLQTQTHSTTWYTDVADTPRKDTSTIPSLARRAPRCKAWMPKARTYCGLPKNHRGPHRS